MKTLLFFLSLLALSACASRPSGGCQNYDEFNKRYVRCGNHGGGAW